MSERCKLIYRKPKKWQPVKIRTNEGEYATVGYQKNPVYLQAEWQLGERKSCSDCERIANRGRNDNPQMA